MKQFFFFFLMLISSCSFGQIKNQIKKATRHEPRVFFYAYISHAGFDNGELIIMKHRQRTAFQFNPKNLKREAVKGTLSYRVYNQGWQIFFFFNQQGDLVNLIEWKGNLIYRTFF